MSFLLYYKSKGALGGKKWDIAEEPPDAVIFHNSESSLISKVGKIWAEK